MGLDAAPPVDRSVEWLRIRSINGGAGGFPAPVGLGEAERAASIAENRAALEQLRGGGYRLVCLLRWGDARTWGGVRIGATGARAPLDLREAYKAGYDLAVTYGDLVDAWELDNEPDIPFFGDNADVFAAFHKAVALGIAAARRGEGQSPGARGQRPVASGQLFPRGEMSLRSAGGRVQESAEVGFQDAELPATRYPLLATRTAPSLVLMAAPALPPGPHFEQLLANGYLSYTEGFNYHYYGFAMDYAGVYGSFRDAVAEAVASSEQRVASRKRAGAARVAVSPYSNWSLERVLPVFLTEWGYSLLDGYDAQTVEGRVRQWRYFKEVALENERLGIAAPMAFLLRPYYEYKAKEFGLIMPAPEARQGHYGFVTRSGRVNPNDEIRMTNSDLGSKIAHETHERSRRVESDLNRDASGTENVLQAPRSSPLATFRAGGLEFRVEDFGASEVEPWMERIGEKMGGGEVSPALAWLLDAARRGDGGVGDLASKGAERAKTEGGLRTEATRFRYGAECSGVFHAPGWETGPDGASADTIGNRSDTLPPRAAGIVDWRVRTEAASPVVMDLISGDGVSAVKSYQGYFLSEGGGSERSGKATLVLYNFAKEAAEVRIQAAGDFMDFPAEVIPEVVARLGPRQPALATRLISRAPRFVLAPGERREVAVTLRAPWGQLRPLEARLRAVVKVDGGYTVSRWATRLYASPEGYAPYAVQALDFPAEAAAGNRARVLERTRAPEEPALVEQGRWLVTPGVQVVESEGGWMFHVDAFPGVALRPAVVELPLPDDFAMPEGTMLSYDYRITPATFALRRPLAPDAVDATKRNQTGGIGDLLESYIRTQDGKLFSTQPRLAAGLNWRRYNQPAESMTMHFLGRTTPPWRFSENKPAALVFFLRPSALPTAFEIARPQVARWGSAAPHGGAK